MVQPCFACWIGGCSAQHPLVVAQGAVSHKCHAIQGLGSGTLSQAAAEEQLRRMGALALAGQVGGWGGGRGAQSWEYAVTRVVVHR